MCSFITVMNYIVGFVINQVNTTFVVIYTTGTRLKYEVEVPQVVKIMRLPYFYSGSYL